MVHWFGISRLNDALWVLPGAVVPPSVRRCSAHTECLVPTGRAGWLRHQGVGATIALWLERQVTSLRANTAFSAWYHVELLGAHCTSPAQFSQGQSCAPIHRMSTPNSHLPYTGEAAI